MKKFKDFVTYQRAREDLFKTEVDPHLARTIATCKSVRSRESLFSIIVILESIRVDKLLFEHNTEDRLSFIQEMVDAVYKADKTIMHEQRFSEIILDELYCKLQGLKVKNADSITNQLFLLVKSFKELTCMTPSAKNFKLALELQRTFETLVDQTVKEEEKDMLHTNSIPIRFKQYEEVKLRS